jgi:serralysin
MALDIAALQLLYGANTSTRAGNDTYGLPTADAAGTFWQAIWDAGGTDVITHAGGTISASIDLREAPLTGENAGGYVSWVQGTRGGFTIANGVVIENAIGGNAGDTITGNDAANTLDGGLGDDLIAALAGADSVVGGGGNDTVYGHGGNDTIEAAAGKDYLDGGDGYDVVDYSGSNFNVTVDLGRLDTMPPSGPGAFGDTLIGFEAVIGGAGQDWLGGVGNVGGSSVDGRGGADTVFAGDDADVLRGGMGNDLVQGNGGADTLYGGDSDLIVNGSFEVVTGVVVKPDGWAEYVDSLEGWGLLSGIGRELFTDGIGVAPWQGEYGIDMEAAQANSNIAITQQVSRAVDGVLYRIAFEARTLNDSVSAELEVYWGGSKLNWGGATGNIIAGTTLMTYWVDVRGGEGEAADENRLTFREVGGGDAHGTLLDNIRMYRIAEGEAKATDRDPTGDGNDTFNPGQGSDAVFGHGGDDVANFAETSAQMDSFDGGLGTDLLVMDWHDVTTGIRYFGLDWENSQSIGVAESYRNDVLGNLRLYFKQVEQFRLTGGSGYDQLKGGELADTLVGNAGDDTLISGGGGDLLDGGDGFDFATVKLTGSGNNSIDMKLLAAGGSATLSDGTRLLSIEGISLEAGEGNDLLDVRGTVTVEGSRGPTSFSGMGGADTLAVDLLTSDDATYDGGTGNDLLILDWSAAEADITNGLIGTGGLAYYKSVYASGTINGQYYELSYDAYFRNVERFDITSGTGNDALLGGAGNDRIKVIGGRDSATLGDGSDDLLVMDWAGYGTRINYDGAYRTAFEGSLATGYAGSYGQDDQRFGNYVVFSGVERFDVRLGEAGDLLRTGDGADTVLGLGGDDHLITGKGIDVVDGGAGDDRWEADKSELGTAQPMTLDLTAAGVQASYGGTGSVRGIEMLSLTTGAGNDAVRTLAAGFNDQVTTGDGADTVIVAGGRDLAYLGDGSDLLVVDWTGYGARINVDGAYRVGFAGSLATGYEGSFGQDDQRFGNYIGFSGVERFALRLGTEGDLIRTGDGADTVLGNGGDDHLITGKGADSIHGGDGTDRWTADKSDATANMVINLASDAASTYTVGGIAAAVQGIEALGHGEAEGEFFHSGSGNDRITTRTDVLSDFIMAHAGADTVVVAGGRDVVDLGAGDDLLSVDWTGYANRINFDGSYRLAFAGSLAAGYEGSYGQDDQRFGNYVRFYGVERFDVRLGVAGDLLLTGDGADTVLGNGGDDHLVTGKGADSIDGGMSVVEGATVPGADRWTADKSDATLGMVIDLTSAARSTYVVGGRQGAVQGIEALGHDTAAGAWFQSGAGNDRIVTRGDNLSDFIRTNDGADTVALAGGRDVVELGAGADLLVVDWTGYGTRINADGSYRVGFGGSLATGYEGSFGQDDQRFGYYVGFSGVERFDLKLGTQSDFIRTGDGADTVLGNEGDDHLVTGKGIDVINGGAGNDRWEADKSDLAANQAMVLNLAAVAVQGSYGGTGSVRGIEMLSLTTGAGNDAIRTLDVWFDDQLTTGAGADTVTVAGGRDLAYLGDGSDLLVVDWTGYGTRINADGSYRVGFGGSLAAGYEGSFGQDDQRFGYYVGFSGVERFDLRLGTQSDFIRTGDGADTVLGNEGDDHLVTGKGIDVIDGGTGNDRWEADKSDLAANQAMVLDLTAVAVQGSYGGTGSLRGIEMLSLTTGAGNDAIRTLDVWFDDQLTTGAGADTVTVASGRDLAYLGDGSDLLVVDWGSYGTRINYDGAYRVGFAGSLATGYEGSFGQDDQRFGWYVGFSGVERFDLRLGTASDLIRTGDGADTIAGNDGADYLLAGGGADTLSGGAGDDTLDAGDGADTLRGGLGTDSLLGGAGNDLYLVEDASDLVSDSAGADTVSASVSFTLGTGLEALELTGTAAAGTGNALDNLLLGNAIGNNLSGGDGADTLQGKGGADTLAGGLGNDLYILDDGLDVLSDAGGADTIASAQNRTLAAGFEALVLTGAATNGTGNADANLLVGNALANQLNGGAGADTMQGGGGDDLYIVDSIGDTIGEATGAGADTVRAGVSHTLASGVEALVLTGGDSLSGTGNALDNALVGNNGANSLSGANGNDYLAGLAGADTLSGGSGADTMQGGLGDDRYFVDNGADVVTELDTQGRDEVIASVSFILSAHVELLRFSGAADLSGTGNALGNQIAGNNGANLLAGLDGVDSLLGGLGADTLVGGMGADRLTGGGGADRFRFASPDEGADLIIDFVHGEDLVVLDAAGFGLSAGTPGADNFVSKTTNGATIAATPQFVYNSVAGILFFDADGLGGGAAVRLATFTGAPGLTASDLLLIA